MAQVLKGVCATFGNSLSRVGQFARLRGKELLRYANDGVKPHNFSTMTAATGSYRNYSTVQGYKRIVKPDGTVVNRYTTTFSDGSTLFDSVSSRGIRQAKLVSQNGKVTSAYGENATQNLVRSAFGNETASVHRYHTGSIDVPMMTNQGGFVDYLQYV